MIQQNRILIIDFDSQYSQLIARRIREQGVYCELKPATITDQEIKQFAPQGIILSGGAQSVHDADSYRAPQMVFSIGCPVLGICYGMQTMAQQLGGAVQTSSAQAEFGHAPISINTQSALFRSINTESLNVWMSHNDHVAQLPQGFSCIAQNNRCKLAAMENTDRQYYGIQFHAEVTNTQQGATILKNFVQSICKVKASWQPKNIIEEQIEAIQNRVKEDQVILATSGGVDSSVVAALLHKAIGTQLHCVFVDTGLVRFNELDAIDLLKNKLGVHIECIDARDQFLHALKGITDPEQKRKVIGREFITVFQEHAKKIKDAQWLAQGTIYPDVIESASDHKTIKSHHNVGGLPAHMHLKILEPIRTLFKDEVRKLGIELGLPKESVYRHPFPGPGLGVRILGEIKKEDVDTLRKADKIFLDELRAHNLYDDLAQAFAVFLPIKSVGVKGDARHYGHVIALRAVTSTDFMTANWADLPRDFLAHVSNRIVNEINSISRVVYDISSKPPATIEWE